MEPFETMLSEEHEALVKRQQLQKNYDYNHACCPACNNDVESTEMAFIWANPNEAPKDTNRATCHECGWRGIVDDCAPPKPRNADHNVSDYTFHALNKVTCEDMRGYVAEALKPPAEPFAKIYS